MRMCVPHPLATGFADVLTVPRRVVMWLDLPRLHVSEISHLPSDKPPLCARTPWLSEPWTFRSYGRCHMYVTCAAGSAESTLDCSVCLACGVSRHISEIELIGHTSFSQVPDIARICVSLMCADFQPVATHLDPIRRWPFSTNLWRHNPEIPHAHPSTLPGSHNPMFHLLC